MPKEKFYLSGQIDGDGNPPDFTVSWGTDHEGDSTTLITGPDEKPYIIAKPNDTVGLTRLIRALTRARTHMIQNRGAQPLIEVPDWLKADRTKPRPRPDEIIDNGPDQMPTHWAMDHEFLIAEHEHKPRQHRDGRPPWCDACGLTEEHRLAISRINGEPAALKSGPFPARVPAAK